MNESDKTWKLLSRWQIRVWLDCVFKILDY